MNEKICPICDKATLEFCSEQMSGNVAGRPFAYVSQFSHCKNCGSKVTTAMQIDANRLAVVKAQRAAIDAPSPLELEAWRKRWGLTQAQAGDLTGTGRTAFSKYENSAMVPSLPTSKFLKTLLRSDDATRESASEAGVALKPDSQPFHILKYPGCMPAWDVDDAGKISATYVIGDTSQPLKIRPSHMDTETTAVAQAHAKTS